MRRVVVPPSPGLVSAFGTLIADERIDRRLTLVRRLDRTDAQDLAAELEALVAQARDELLRQRHAERASSDVVLGTLVACRYAGQNYEQEIPIEPGAPSFAAELAARFHASHERAYGYSMEDQPVESVYVAAAAIGRAGPVELRPYDPTVRGAVAPGTREILVGPGETAEAAIVRRASLVPGDVLRGPALVEEADSTTYVPPGFRATVHETQCLVVEAG